MSVLVLAPPDDEHAQAVAQAIGERGGEVDVVDLAAFPEQASLVMTFDCCGSCSRTVLRTERGDLDVQQVGSVWLRRANHPVVTDDMASGSHRAFAANECHEALGGLWASLDACWINDPQADDRGHRKGYQLATARRVGLEIPRTLMTNDPQEALQFVDALGYRDVVYKTFSSTRSEWRETRLLRREELDLLPLVRHAPVIFQRYVPARYDLRVTVVGDELFPVAIHSQASAYPVDCRIDIGNTRLEAVEIPDTLAAALRNLMGRMHLVYGAIDLRLTPEGDYVFLEVNPAGQYRYLEVATGLPITDALADNLLAADRNPSSG